MPLFNEYAPPSENNDDRHVRGSAFRPYMHPGTSSKEGSVQAQSPTTRMRIISKRMRSENHKHSIGDFVTGDQEPTTSTDRVDATVRAFAQSLKMKEIFSLDSHQDDDNADDMKNDVAIATHYSHNDDESTVTPPPAKQHRTHGGLSPPPTPGRNHAAAQSYHSSLSHPTFLPLGDRLRLDASDSSHRFASTMPLSPPGSASTKVPSSLLDVYLQSAPYRIRPNFTSPWLQNLNNGPSKKSTQHQAGSDEIGNSVSADGDLGIPELPFAAPLYPPTRQLEHQQEEGSSKVATDMTVATLPPTRGIFERAIAA